MIKNKVVIVGGDHHNGLNLARMIGKRNIAVTAMIVTDNNYSFMSHSKYIDEYHIFHTEKEAFDYILANYISGDEKPFIIPYSDGAAQELDIRLDEFSRYFYVPSIDNKQGEIARLMNKKEQYDWAVENNIKMAKSEVIKLQTGNTFADKWSEYPCILKPIVSAQGIKADIEICQNKSELEDSIKSFIEKDYKSVLIQPYLTIDYEIVVFGCICKNISQPIVIPNEVIRTFPINKGTNCFSKIITDEKIIDACRNIIIKLQKTGFYGLYDVELLVVNNEVYLNEINYRNSGGDYRIVSQGYFYPLIWINDCLGIDNNEFLNYKLKPTYSMTFWYDYQHVKHGRISFKEWIKDVKKTSSFALYYKGDMKPVYSYYYHSIIGRLKRILRLK